MSKRPQRSSGGGLGGLASSPGGGLFSRRNRGLVPNEDPSSWLTSKPAPKATVTGETQSDATVTTEKKEAGARPVPAPRKKRSEPTRYSPVLSRGNGQSGSDGLQPESTKPRPHSFHGEDSLKGYVVVVTDDNVSPGKAQASPTSTGHSTVSNKPVAKPRSKNSNKSSPVTISPVHQQTHAEPRSDPSPPHIPTSNYLSPYRLDQSDYSSSGPPSLLPMVDYSLEPRMFGEPKLPLGQAKGLVDVEVLEEEDCPVSSSPPVCAGFRIWDDENDEAEAEDQFTSPPPKPPRPHRRASSPSTSPPSSPTFRHSNTMSDFRPVKEKGGLLSKLSPILQRKKRSVPSPVPDTDHVGPPKAHKRLFVDPNLRKLKEFLEQPGADPNIRNDAGDTPLLHYVRHQHKTRLDRMYMVLYHGKGVKVDAQDAAGNTALHIAAQKGDAAYGKALLVFGADHKAFNSKRQLPIDLAKGDISTVLSRLDNKPDIEDDDTVTSLPDEINTDTWHELRNARLAALVSDRNMFNFAYWMEKNLEEASKGDKGLASIKDFDLSHAEAAQGVELRRWQETARPVRPGGRILFLDGGGIRGLMLVEMLMEIERRTGRKITELFDWFIGTSIGSVVAAGLVYAKKSLEEIRGLLFRLKAEVFSSGGFKGTLLNVAGRSKRLDELFEQEIGNDLLSSVTKPRVMICAVNKTNLKVEFFNNFMDNGALTDVPVWKACRASSAAPIFFTSFDDYVDGGVLANNPCEYAMAAIHQYHYDRMMKQPEFSLAVSVGTGHDPNMAVGDINAFGKGLLDFKKIYDGVKQLVDLFGKALGDSENTAEKFSTQCKARRHPIRFFRFNPQLTEMVPTGETDDETLVNMLVETKCYMAREDIVERMGEVITVFRQLAQYHTDLHHVVLP